MLLSADKEEEITRYLCLFPHGSPMFSPPCHLLSEACFTHWLLKINMSHQMTTQCVRYVSIPTTKQTQSYYSINYACTALAVTNNSCLGCVNQTLSICGSIWIVIIDRPYSVIWKLSCGVMHNACDYHDYGKFTGLFMRLVLLNIQSWYHCRAVYKDLFIHATEQVHSWSGECDGVFFHGWIKVATG